MKIDNGMEFYKKESNDTAQLHILHNLQIVSIEPFKEDRMNAFKCRVGEWERSREYIYRWCKCLKFYFESIHKLLIFLNRIYSSKELSYYYKGNIKRWDPLLRTVFDDYTISFCNYFYVIGNNFIYGERFWLKESLCRYN